MRLLQLAAVALTALILPLVAGAQAIDAGPDAGMLGQQKATAARSGAPSEPARPTVEPGERPAGADAGRSDRDCDKLEAPDAGRGPAPKTDARADRARCRKLTDADIATAPIAETRVVSRHVATVGGRQVAYLATAGTVTIRDDEGKPTASMFYVAYATGDPRRPVTFFYNGGPGSSSMWLHMGSLAPRRVVTDSPEPTHNPPYRLVDNDSSLIDRSDLVFLDAVGAGFSRPLGDTKLSAFWGTDPDIDAFARGIERWLTVNDRWNAPKFLFGESYGTTRSAGLAYRLQRDGVQLNGVILLSSILNYGRRQPGFDQEMINYLPSYAAAAAYHHKLAEEPADLAAYLQEVREFARGPYATALAKGQNLADAERQAIAAKMSAYTGLPVEFLIEADVRVTPQRFRKELMRSERLTLGRYDDRFTGEDIDAAGESPEYDPSDTGITGAFVAAFHTYLAEDLGYRSDLTYRPTYYESGTRWDFSHKPPSAGGGFGAAQPQEESEADVALDLSQAMRENPHLLLFSLNGLYDLATPFFGTEYDLAHMQLDPRVRGNVRFAYYPSGHMVYLNPEALKAMKADLARFYDEAAPPG